MSPNKVANIQEKGVAGVYDSQFAEIERYLERARSVLESNPEMNSLADTMRGIESQTNRGETRLNDIERSFGNIERKNDEQKATLASLESELDTFRAELAELQSKLERVEDKDPFILWQRIQQAVENAHKYEILAKVYF